MVLEYLDQYFLERQLKERLNSTIHWDYAHSSWSLQLYKPFKSRKNQEVRNVRFLENLACFVFLKHTFSYSPFCLITNDLRGTNEINLLHEGHPFHQKNILLT